MTYPNSDLFKCIEIINSPPFTLTTTLKIKASVFDSKNNKIEIIKDDNGGGGGGSRNNVIISNNTTATNNNNKICDFISVIKPKPIPVKEVQHLLSPFSNLSTFNSNKSLLLLSKSNSLSSNNNNSNNKLTSFSPVSSSSTPLPSPSSRQESTLKQEIHKNYKENQSSSFTYIKVKPNKNSDNNSEIDVCRFIDGKIHTKKKTEFDQYGRNIKNSMFLFQQPPLIQIDSKGNVCQIMPYPADMKLSIKHV